MDYPDTPVNRDEFTAKVIELFHGWESVVADDLPIVVHKICGILNLSVTNPRLGALTDKNVWVIPAQTGIGKSVCIQVYVSMLREVGALLLLPLKAEVRQYAENINEYAGDQLACCSYSYQYKSDGHRYLVKDSEEWQNYSCLIVTHSKYKAVVSQQEKELDKYRYYKGSDGNLRPRELVIIDEKLSLYSRTSVAMDDFSRLISFLENAIRHTLDDTPVCQLNELVEQLRVIYGYLDKATPERSDTPTIDIDPFNIRERLLAEELIENIRYDLVKEIIQKRITEFSEEMESVTVGAAIDLKKVIKDTIKIAEKLADRLENIIIEKSQDSEFFYKNFSIYKSGRDSQLFKVNSLSSPLGTCVVFDATATVNKYYEYAEKGMFSNLKLFDVPQIRKYSNLTIHKAKGYYQSKHALGIGATNNSKTELGGWLDFYAGVANSILQPDDQLLIISYKDFVDKLKGKLKDVEGIAYTHWGKHVGSNEWKDCNKVIIIGWNNLPAIETISRIYGTGIGTGDINISRLLTNGVVVDFARSQVVDDLVQGAMRCRARVINSPDADCESAELYLFYPDNPAGYGVMELFEEQFPNAQVYDWEPVITPPIKKGKSERNADQVLEVIDRYAAEVRSVLWKVIWEEAGLKSGQANRLKGNSYFIDELSRRGYELVSDISDARSYSINF